MSKLPDAVDLASLIKSLEGHPDHATLEGLAKAAQRAQSCAADLAMAETTMEALAQASIAKSMLVTPLHLAAIQYGLVANAVVLYARATSTHSDGGERGSISISDRLSPDELEDHKIIVELRNRVIAHVHTDEAIGDNVWHQERMIIREDPDGRWLPGCVTRRVQVHEATTARLRRMIPTARKLIRSTFYKHIGRLAEALNHIGLNDEMFRHHNFDAVAFFGSYENALHGLTPSPGGSARGIVG